MGCVSSKLLKKNVKQDVLFGSGDLPNHVVSLTSSTYGALKLDLTQIQKHTQTQTQTQTQIVSSPCTNPTDKKNEEDDRVQKKKADDFEAKDALEVINTWELMEGLEEETAVASSNRSNWKGIRSPFKRLVNHVSSPIPSPSPSPSPKEGNRNGPKLVGKENKTSAGRSQQCFTTPRSKSKSKSKSGALRFSSNSTNNRVRRAASESESPRRSDSSSSTRRRRSLEPLFDPELIESLEKELSLENNEEQIKEVVKVMVPQKSYEEEEEEEEEEEREKGKCPGPPGGENCVVMYTTTLRGIRKTFEECNTVRSAIEAYHVRVIERDISMDSGFKEELRKLMKQHEQEENVRVPVVFVKGQLIGGAEEVVRLDEEGRLQALLQGIPMAASSVACQGCGGMRFVMCMDCNGSCKVLMLDLTNHHHPPPTVVVRCGECNENGLIQCPLCS